MAGNSVVAWPARESLTRLGVPRPRIVLDAVLMGSLATWAVSSAYASGDFTGWRSLLPVAVLLVALGVFAGYYELTLSNRLLPSLGLLAVLGVLGWGAYEAGAEVSAAVLWILGSAMALERLPLAFALAVALTLATFFTVILTGTTVLGRVITVAGIVLGGYALRLDAQARGAGFRLLAQERAAREAEATSAALAERARIAREIHDVLAHSLSAQLVHLEAARIQVERGPQGPFRDQVLERVTAARGMARQGLAETRQALSALRGELASAEEYLREAAAEDGAEVAVTGEPRPLSPQTSQAVRRAAQEALTNARKHAPGCRVRIALAYEEGGVTLEVRDSGARGPCSALGASGSGYGLLGMRERAELLGGTLDAGPEGAGFMVRLWVPL
ncbi:sensor histidine kinase [Streptomyces sp. NPDC020412]|uniref:sensor histidine kinase n=1 Tax=Streptomyces sp. NPDC020412 TaxID=3365073 RepID=UPI003799FDB3